ncbi:hypothetical protein BDR05DRAFT_967554 [Suillus weaverae]|nr:hypothetical protein BDR05DRAFT_967554 [Suillus weaverae]
MTSSYIIMDYTCETDGTFVSIGMSHNCSLAYFESPSESTFSLSTLTCFSHLDLQLHTIFVKRDGTTPNHNLGMIRLLSMGCI